MSADIAIDCAGSRVQVHSYKEHNLGSGDWTMRPAVARAGAGKKDARM